MPTYIDLIDEELVVWYKEGDRRAFEELYNRYEQKLKRVIFYYVSDKNEVEDIFHEVMIRVLKHIKGFNKNKKFSSWIYQIAINCSKNSLVRHKRDTEIIGKEKFRIKDNPERSRTPEDELIRDFDMEQFNSAIASLQDKFREVFLFRFDQNMPYSQIGNVLNCSERTAKWRMEKAIEKITYYLKEREII